MECFQSLFRKKEIDGFFFAGNDWSDIDSIIDSGSKLTTIDRDEWMKSVGEPDGRGCRILLSLRLPDGNRQTMEVEDTTTLKVNL